MMSPICGIQRIQLVNITKKKQIHRENKLVVTRGERGKIGAQNEVVVMV